MAADGKTPPNPPTGGGGNIMCTCSIFVCRHKNNDMSTLLGHAHTYIPTDRQTHRHTYINQYKHIVIPIHGCICVTYPPFGGGGGGEPGGAGSYIYIYYPVVHVNRTNIMQKNDLQYIAIIIHMHNYPMMPISFLRNTNIDATYKLNAKSL